MVFREAPPSPELRLAVAAVWTCEIPRGAGGSSTLVPDGCVERVAALRGGFEVAAGGGPFEWTVVGIADAPLPIAYRDPALLVGIRLTPAGACRLLGCRVRDATGRAADGADLLAAPRRRELMAAAREHAHGRPEPLERSLAKAFADAPAGNPRLVRALEVLHAAPAGTSVAAVARTAGISPRQLDRATKRALGVRPKLLLRIARFRRAFELGMYVRRGDWAAVAAACGYADQAHLCRDFQEFAGESPERSRTEHAEV